jgi:hypothetical protein
MSLRLAGAEAGPMWEEMVYWAHGVLLDSTKIRRPFLLAAEETG